MAGTSVVSLENSNYVVAAGFTPGLPDDFGLLRFDPDGQVQAQRYTSDREHTSGLAAQLSGNSLWVKAIALESGKLGLVFDDVWLPEVGTDDTLAGWQVSPGSNHPAGWMLTDLVKAEDGFFLRAVVSGPPAHLAILKVRPNGTVDWAAEYPTIRVEQKGKMFLTSEGQLLTGGYIRTEDDEKAVVLWVNQDGSLFRSVTVKMEPYKLFSDAQLAKSSGYQDLALLPDGDIILVQDFGICARSCPGSGTLITRLTPNGEHIWTVGLHALGHIGGTTFVREIRQEGDQLILVGGSTAFNPPGDYSRNQHIDILMAKLDRNGQPVWIRSLGQTKISSSSREYKTDYANALLPIGDGRMIVTGTSDSFGSDQNFDGAPYIQHYDLVLGMVGLDNGGIQGASGLMWTPDLNDEYDVWADQKSVSLGTCNDCDVQYLEGISLDPVIYTAESLELVNRDLNSGLPDNLKGLQFSVLDDGRGLISSSTFLTDPNQDIDHDGLDQTWENAALELVKPIIELDEEELWLENRDQHYVVLFTRVSPYPSPDLPTYILFQYAVTWSYDYGAEDVIESHRGDVELVILAFRVQTERSLQLEWVYTSAHGGVNNHAGAWHVDDPTCNRAYIADTGYLSLDTPETVGTELMCAEITFKRNRVWLLASENKHALYPSRDVCENHAHLVAWTGGEVWGEDCGGGGEFLFDAYNIGEPYPYLIENLGNTSLWSGLTESQVEALHSLFPNEKVTGGNAEYPTKFCGGLLAPPENCAGSTIASKLSFPPPGTLETRLGPTTYRVRIQTKDVLLAGTDAEVSITLYAEDGSQFSEVLDGSFERNSVDIFHIGNPSNYLGDIAKIGLRRNDDESNPDYYIDLLGFQQLDLSDLNPTADWNVGKVQVEDTVTGNRWVFTINQDLTDSNLHEYLPDSEP